MASLTVTSLSRQVQTALPLKSGLTLMSVQHVERLRGGGWLRSETAQGALSKSDKNTGKVKESRPEGRSAADQQDSNVVTRAAAKMSSIFRSTDEQEFDCVPSNLLPASKKEFVSGVLARCMPRLYAVLRILLEVVGFLFLGSIIAVPVLTLILDRFGSTFYTDFFAAMSKSDSSNPLEALASGFITLITVPVLAVIGTVCLLLIWAPIVIIFTTAVQAAVFISLNRFAHGVVRPLLDVAGVTGLLYWTFLLPKD